MSWDKTIEYLKMLDIKNVPVLYDGVYNEKLIKNLYPPENDLITDEKGNIMEGYVVRKADSFHYKEFKQ